MSIVQYTSSFEIDFKDKTVCSQFLPPGAMLLYAVGTHREGIKTSTITVYYMAQRNNGKTVPTCADPVVRDIKYLFHVAHLGRSDLPEGLGWCSPLRIEGLDTQRPHFLFYSLKP